jgi:hypothetical protein
VEEQTFVWGEHPTAPCEVCHAPTNLWEYIFGEPFPRLKAKPETDQK